jgi:hypothetical protein
MEIKVRLPQYEFEVIYRGNVKGKSFDYYDSFDLIYILDVRLSIPYNLKHKTVIGIRSEFSYLNSRMSTKEYYSRYIENRAKAFHVVNVNQLHHFGFEKTIPIFLTPHGVDINVFNDTPEIREKPIIGINGNKASGGRKGFDIVEKASNLLGLELKTSTHNKNGQHLTKNEMPEFYKSIDIYCNMSETEGLNNSIMEAGAMGKIVIATPVGAAPEMIVPGETGFLCARNADMLVKTITTFLKHREKYSNLGNNLRNLIRERWSWDLCARGFNELFEENLK